MKKKAVKYFVKPDQAQAGYLKNVLYFEGSPILSEFLKNLVQSSSKKIRLFKM